MTTELLLLMLTLSGFAPEAQTECVDTLPQYYVSYAAIPEAICVQEWTCEPVQLQERLDWVCIMED